ncbi:membrane protein [Streptomyces violarus]|uniref:Uma2 family endonuclease n=1 Tax=Streptomyces violarus TaxID=67380 RepID=A0A7W4ZPD5_9ACTN|nr:MULTISPECIES: Uma2 family endonuclease [Streptomyces]MBB3076212.1 Uma2 family endonuclease [Streptomyces violarus]WRT99033.1 Uma2 family endonuclease [Streptomyces sp. CGMCC 4.1772]GHD11595.1 membrane protein [Streptomyces violarus]
MSAASVEQPFPHEEPVTLTTIADEIMARHPGYRVEIIGGHLLVTPSPDVPHARALTKLMRPFIVAGLDDGETEVLQNVGLRLPTGAEDYAIPDLVVVDADIDDHFVENNAYDPVCFRLVLEVTSGNWKDDLKTKVTAYAEAKVPVYVIVDRKHQRLHVLTDPAANGYENHRPHAPGEIVALPDSIGAKVSLDVAEILRAGQPKQAG